MDAMSAFAVQTIPAYEHHLIGASLALMLEHADLQPDVAKRISVLWMLYTLHKNDSIVSNPNSYVFARILKAPVLEDGLQRIPYSLAPVERHFATILLTGPPSQYLRRTSRQIVEEFSHSLPPPLPIPDLRPFLTHLPEDCVLAAPDLAAVAMDPVSDARSTYIALVERSLEHHASVDFVRSVPPLMDCGRHEMVWMTPVDCTYVPVWDPSLSAASDQARQFMKRAFVTPLTAEQAQTLKAEFQAHPDFGIDAGLTPARLPELVENNPLVAIEALLALMGTGSPQLSEYLSLLVSMDMSLHSMEVVNRLTTVVELPSEFMHLYIANCISTCQKTKDKQLQNRLVRLVCVFLQSLITKKLINVLDQYLEIQAFCIEFSRIKEAAALFRVLKSVEHGDKAAAPADA